MKHTGARVLAVLLLALGLACSPGVTESEVIRLIQAQAGPQGERGPQGAATSTPARPGERGPSDEHTFQVLLPHLALDDRFSDACVALLLRLDQYDIQEGRRGGWDDGQLEQRARNHEILKFNLSLNFQFLYGPYEGLWRY